MKTAKIKEVARYVASNAIIMGCDANYHNEIWEAQTQFL